MKGILVFIILSLACLAITTQGIAAGKANKDAGVTIPQVEYERLFYNHVRQEITEGVDFEISNIKVRGVGTVPNGRYKLEVVSSGKQDMLGYTSVTAFIYVNGKQARRVNISGWVHQYKVVAHASGNLKKGAVISAADVRLIRKDISKLPSNVIVDSDNVIGKKMRQSVRAGDYLRLNMVENAAMVGKGDKVAIIAESGLLKVTAMGRSLDNGCKGDLVRVENISSRKMVSGRVTGPSTVAAQF
ncbi:MAG: flagellar basal body P-ring formation chaperone FlgA [Pseudomonadota bacterium]